LESQRVKGLTEGYLRGWLSFIYPVETSQLREELILDYILETRLANHLETKLNLEAVLVAGMSKKTKNVVDPLFSVLNTIAELKLPLFAVKDKIEQTNQPKVDQNDLKPAGELTKEDIERFKSYLAEAQNNSVTK
jgi:hypothetical protein